MSIATRLLLALAVGAVPVAARGQDAPASTPATAPTSAPTSAPADVERLTARITSVTGMAQVRPAPGERWQRAEVGMELAAGAEVRTGTRSRVVCAIDPDQTITLDRLGTISILDAYRDRGRTTTDLIMKYGRTDYAIETAGREHDATIRTPNSTLAVRGTAFTAYDQPPFEPQVETARGLVDFRAARRTVSVGRGSRARGGQGPVETALESTVVDPALAKARTASENVVIATEISRGAVLEFDPLTQITTSRGGRPQADAELIGSLPGRLNFVIRWDQPGSDLNLAVLKLAGNPLELLGAFEPSEVLYPGFNLDTTITGGRIVVDDRGGPSGGQEIGFYNAVENGLYGLQALHVSGPGATVSFNAFLDGEPQTLFATQLDENGEPVPRPGGFGFVTEFAATITRRVEPGNLEVATALVPFPPELQPAPAARRSTSSVTRRDAAAGSTRAANQTSPTQKPSAGKRETSTKRTGRPSGKAGKIPRGVGRIPSAR